LIFRLAANPARSNCPMPTPKKAATPKNALSKPVQPDAALVSDAELFANRSALFANGGAFRYAPL
jgi:hypothetical protein